MSDFQTRSDVAIETAADTLLAVCALQTGLDPVLAWERAQRALELAIEEHFYRDPAPPVLLERAMQEGG